MNTESQAATAVKCPACLRTVLLARAPAPDEEIQLVCPFCETFLKRRARELLAS